VDWKCDRTADSKTKHVRNGLKMNLSTVYKDLLRDKNSQSRKSPRSLWVDCILKSLFFSFSRNTKNRLFNVHFFSLHRCFHIKDQIIGVFCFEVFPTNCETISAYNTYTSLNKTHTFSHTHMRSLSLSLTHTHTHTNTQTHKHFPPIFQ